MMDRAKFRCWNAIFINRLEFFLKKERKKEETSLNIFSLEVEGKRTPLSRMSPLVQWVKKSIFVVDRVALAVRGAVRRHTV